MLFIGAILLAIGLISAEGIAGQERENVVVLKEVVNPSSITVSSDRISIVEGRSGEIFMYSLNGGRFLGKFGRTGQGPGEFDRAPHLIPQPGEWIAISFGKVIYFSETGEFRREVKILPADLMFSGYPIFPLAGRYVGFPFIRDEDGKMLSCVGRIYEEDWKPVVDFTPPFPSPTPPPPPPPGSNIKPPKEDFLLIKDYSSGIVAGNRIYFADSRKGFSISVFDTQGRPVREIRLEEKPVPIERKYRQDLIADWRENMKKYLDIYNPVVPEVFPALFAFRVDGAEIHALTPRRKNGLYEIITLNLEGKILRRSFAFPLEPTWDYLVEVNNQFDIRNGILYTISYNEEKERVELRIATIK